MTLPRMDSVWALYALQKSMMLTPCGPRAVPTGGAGVAAPACSCTLTSAAIFFLGGIPLSLSSRGHDEEYVVRLCHLLLEQPAYCPGWPDTCEIFSRIAGFETLRAAPSKLGFACRSSTSSATVSASFLGHSLTSDLLDLAEAQLDRGLPAEDLDQRLESLRLGVDLGDGRVERRERAVHHHHGVAHTEVGDLDGLLRGLT